MTGGALAGTLDDGVLQREAVHANEGGAGRAVVQHYGLGQERVMHAGVEPLVERAGDLRSDGGCDVRRGETDLHGVAPLSSCVMS